MKNVNLLDTGDLDVLRDLALLAHDNALATYELRASYTSLFDRALIAFTRGPRHRRRRNRTLKKFNLRGWRGAIGVVSQRMDGESHYLCVVCGESIHTNGNGAFIAATVVDRMKCHVALCLALEPGEVP